MNKGEIVQAMGVILCCICGGQMHRLHAVKSSMFSQNMYKHTRTLVTTIFITNAKCLVHRHHKAREMGTTKKGYLLVHVQPCSSH